jgi:hypothetical protein
MSVQPSIVHLLSTKLPYHCLVIELTDVKLGRLL